MFLNKNSTSFIEASESYLLASLLTFTGGYLDVYTYLTRDGVFANAQTGNMVLLGVNIANKNFHLALMYFLPILAFIFGVLLAKFIQFHLKESSKFTWRQITLLVEITVLIFVGFLKNPSYNILANILVSFVCSLQVQSFRKVHGNPFASTMCTGNLRSGSENLFNFFETHNNKYLIHSVKYFGIILFFILGAIVGFYFTKLFNTSSIFLSCIFLLIGYFLIHFDNKKL